MTTCIKERQQLHSTEGPKEDIYFIQQRDLRKTYNSIQQRDLEVSIFNQQRDLRKTFNSIKQRDLRKISNSHQQSPEKISISINKRTRDTSKVNTRGI